MRDMLLIVSFDEANSRSVARKLRAERVYCKIVPADITVEEVKEQEAMGLVLAGASKGVMSLPGFDKGLLDLKLPVLALGDAAAMLCALLGGQASDGFLPQSAAPVTYQTEMSLFADVAEGERMMTCVRPLLLPEGLTPAAYTGEAVIGFADLERSLYGLQFQVEQNDPDGILILSNFALKVCGLTPWWDNEAFIQRAVEEIRRVAGDGTVLCAVSGGVDSGVCALLGHRAVGARLKCIFVDTGLLRKGEADFVLGYYRDGLGLDITRVDASERLLRELSGISDPDRKNQTVLRLLQEELIAKTAQTPNASVLLQGTNYSDIPVCDARESPLSLALRGSGIALAEPVRELFKDEIRRVGEEMGMPQEIYSRQPFPGAGLALRILGDVTSQRLFILREADFIFQDEVEKSGQGKRLWQYFAVLSDLAASGINGTAVCLRAVHSGESAMGMAARLPFDLLERATSRILKTLPQVARVVYDLTPSFYYSGIEWQ